MWKHWQLLLGILTVQVHIIVVLGISVTVSPTSKSVFVNGNVEFRCQIRDKEPDQQLIWIADYNPDDDIWHTIQAEQTSDINHQDNGHGVYSVEYSTVIVHEPTTTTAHNLFLRINGVLAADEGTYTCGYSVFVIDPFPPLGYYRPTSLGEWAALTILIPPNELNPRCSFSPNTISLPTPTSTASVTFTCQMNGGKPPPGLIWFRGRTPISAMLTETNVLQYTLRGDDNGVQFTCVASGESLQQVGSCSVTPLLMNPSVSISNTPMPVTENSNAHFTCVGTGLPRISKIEWLYNGQIFSVGNVDVSFQIVDMPESSSSRLHLSNLQFANNNDVIGCLVKTSTGLNTTQFVIITVIPESTTETPVTSKSEIKSFEPTANTKPTSNTGGVKDSNSDTGFPSFLIVPVAAAVGGLILILVIAIVITVICQRRDKQREEAQTPIVIDRPQNNTYEMGVVDTDNDLQTLSPSAPPGEDYVINQLPGEPSSSATMGSDHPYDPVNIAASQGTHAVIEGRLPNRIQASPYASNIVGRNVEGISYAELAVSNGTPANAIRQTRPHNSVVQYSQIEGEL